MKWFLKNKKIHTMKSLIFILCLGFSQMIQAQVTEIISGFTKNLTKQDLPFSGDRKVFATGLNDRNTENIFVVSKNKIGAEGDELYIEKFTKNASGGYDRTFSHKKTHPKNRALVFVNNRAMLSDVDKDGNMEISYMLQESPNGVDNPSEKTTFFTIFKNEAFEIYNLKEENYQINHFSPNFKKLPSEIQKKLIDFWVKIDKK